MLNIPILFDASNHHQINALYDYAAPAAATENGRLVNGRNDGGV